MNALRLATRARTPTSCLRSFGTASVARADIITDLYLKGIKEYKPRASSASDSEGQVKAWSAPAAPKSPEGVSKEGVTAELDAYASAQEAADTPAGAQATHTKGAKAANDGDWFELDTTPDHAHH
ncbi:ATP synthase F0 subcomplex subunit H atp14 [Savitreella phatthalungensis]